MVCRNLHFLLDGNTIVIRENGTVKNYLAFTDKLGSILSVMDENGAIVYAVLHCPLVTFTIAC